MKYYNYCSSSSARKGASLLLLFGLVLSPAHAAAPTTSTVVVTLTDETFEHTTQAATGQTTGKWFVMFYASWCGHCQRLHPIWDELATSLVNDTDETSHNSILVAKVDAVAARVTAERFSVKSFPTLLFFADRRMYKYDGPRYVADLLAFARTGYHHASPGLDVPAMPSAVELLRRQLMEMVSSSRQVKMLVDDFEHIVKVRKNAAAVLALLGAIVGFVLGCMVGCFGKGSKKITTKEKTA
jgi:protein disulfide-isomerase-like protein